LPPTENHKFE